MNILHFGTLSVQRDLSWCGCVHRSMHCLCSMDEWEDKGLFIEMMNWSPWRWKKHVDCLNISTWIVHRSTCSMVPRGTESDDFTSSIYCLAGMIIDGRGYKTLINGCCKNLKVDEAMHASLKGNAWWRDYTIIIKYNTFLGGSFEAGKVLNKVFNMVWVGVCLYIYI